MKTLISILIVLLGAACCYGSEFRDTVGTYYQEPQALIISENSDEVSVEIIDNEGFHRGFSYPAGGNKLVKSSRGYNRFRADCCGDWDVTTNGLYFGFICTPGSASSLSPDMGKSLEIGWLNILGIERRLGMGWRMSLGVGIDWRNYRSTQGLVYGSENGHVEVSDNPMEGYRFSRIKIFSVQFPLLWTKTFKRRNGLKPGLGFGAIFNCNAHGSVKTSWKDEGGKNRSVSSDNIGQRKFTIDLYGQLRLGDVGVYVRYSPYKILTRTQLLDYRPLSVGVSLFY
ncbi:MAG: hypothetical protein K2H60_13685 [Muribaculaceae bacterium]|nr:hypothetical protein [Muribaculaceae bacterium]